MCKVQNAGEEESVKNNKMQRTGSIFYFQRGAITPAATMRRHDQERHEGGVLPKHVAQVHVKASFPQGPI